MELNEYQDKVQELIEYPSTLGPFYLFMKMYENVGHLSTIINEVMLKREGNMDNNDILAITYVLGNMLINISSISKMFNMSLEDIANISLTNVIENIKDTNRDVNEINNKTSEVNVKERV